MTVLKAAFNERKTNIEGEEKVRQTGRSTLAS